MKNAAPWILAVLAVLATLPIFRLQSPTTAGEAKENKTEESQDAKETEEPKAEKPKEPGKPTATSGDDKPKTCRKEEGKTAPPQPWCEPVRVLREFFGLDSGLDLEEDRSVKDVVDAATGGAGYKLQFLVALVPDPLETTLPINFDLALDAIRRGFAESEYRLDGFWLPWAEKTAKKDRLYRTMPGILLFRYVKGQSGRLAVVFLVGESPKAGIQKLAFLEAVKLASGLKGAALDAEIGILGPSFSGSVDSLLIAIQKSSVPLNSGKSLQLRIASGTATASGLEERFGKNKFCRTVVPVEELQQESFAFLRDEMGWDFRKMAFLTEADTAYGQSSLTQNDLLLVPFPSPISEVRNAWQQTGEPRKPDGKVDVGKAKISTGRSALDLSLEERDAPLDLIPNFSSLTVPSQDLELSNLLETISREDIRYVGILATDVKDKLFLVGKIRQFAPDTVPFTFENSLVFAHPGYAEAMDRVIVISSSPLFTEGADWLKLSSADPGRQRRQFTAEFQEGIFEAVRYLLKSKVQSQPQIWISAVGNGSLWPIARLPVPSKKSGIRYCASVPAEHRRSFRDNLAGKADLQVLLMAGALCMLSLWLQKVGLLKESGAAGPVLRSLHGPLLVSGSFLLAAAAGVLLVVGALPIWARIFSLDWPVPTRNDLLFVAGLAVVYFFLVLQLARAAMSRTSLLEYIISLLGGVFALPVLLWLIFRLWMPGEEIEFFHLRVRAFSSGFSPLVSLALLGGALYAWVLCELKRRWLLERQAADCPLEALCEYTVAGCGDVRTTLQDLTQETLPKNRWHWIFPVAVFGPVLILLWETVQPVTEREAYGRVFLPLAVVIASLAALSFYRFVRIWWSTRRLLERLDNASPKLAKAFEDISKDLDWKPMKSFGTPLPSFKVQTLSADKLIDLKFSKVDPDALRKELEEIFNAEASGYSGDELRHRKNVEDIFKKACQELRNHVEMLGARNFLALRVAAYLRYIFAHLRNCLLGALGTGLLLLSAVTTYAFEPKQFVSLAIWLGLAVAVALTFWIFLQMDRNATLSRIGHTDIGQITFDRTFYVNVFLYVGVPVLGLIATQFPEIGRLLGRLADQLFRIAGGG